MDSHRVAEAQLRVVLALQYLVMLDQRLAEQFEGPDVALEGRQAFMVRHGAPPGWCARRGTGCRSSRRLGMGWPHGLGGGERMRGSSVSWWSCMSSFRCGTTTARGQASLGGSSTRVGRPGRKGPGTPEGVPRTTAMTRHRGHKKSACDEDWALLRLSIPTGQGRVADASTTE